MKLGSKNIVELKSGKRGVVATIMEQPWLIVFNNFTVAINKYDDNLNHKNDNYSIARVWKCRKKDYDVKKVWSRAFDESELMLILDRRG